MLEDAGGSVLGDGGCRGGPELRGECEEIRSIRRRCAAMMLPESCSVGQIRAVTSGSTAASVHLQPSSVSVRLSVTMSVHMHTSRSVYSRRGWSQMPGKRNVLAVRSWSAMRIHSLDTIFYSIILFCTEMIQNLYLFCPDISVIPQ